MQVGVGCTVRELCDGQSLASPGRGDRNELPIDFWFLDLILRASADPEVHQGAFAQGVKVGPGTRMPRLPALYRPKRRWRLESQRDPQAYLEEEEQ